RNRLQKALGGGNQFVHPQVGAVGCQPGDLFLLCTDGLTEGLHDQQLAGLLREAQAAGALDGVARRLVEAALAADGRDNITALVIEAG
ncbi:MAG TPA: SpoIIE family protein phosphatase, partial [Verrucomicrobiota bacterium]|nr:SpoIIE family protein phosphatase [Verrucomicrobiota bacterium]